jgi:hypothetical protein
MESLNPKRKIDVEKMVEAIRRKLKALHEDKIVSGELGLLKIGAEAAFNTEALVNGNRLIEIRTDIYSERERTYRTEISLHRSKEGEQFFITSDSIKTIPTVFDAIEAVREIRDRMNSGTSYEEAIQDYKI